MKPGAKFAAALLEMHPIDNVVAVVHSIAPAGMPVLIHPSA